MLIEQPPEWFRSLFPGAHFRFPSQKGSKPRVFLTFDDGPIPEVTPWVLDVLDRFNVKATFFMVGQNVERNPELLKMIIERGHEAGNHTLHHIRGLGIKAQEYMQDCRQGEILTESNLLRPPHGFMTLSQFKAAKSRYRIIMYDVVTRDYSRKLNSENVFRNIRKYTRDGSIIVFHDSLKSFPRLKEALPLSLEWLLKEGYEFKLISEAVGEMDNQSYKTEI